MYPTIDLKTLSRALLIGSVACGTSAMAGASPASTLPGQTDSARLAQSAGEILRDFSGPAAGEFAKTSDAIERENPFALETQGEDLRFNTLHGTPNVQSHGVDEVGRPLWIIATNPHDETAANIVFRNPAALREALQRRDANERMSYSVLSGGVTINDLLDGAAASGAEKAAGGEQADEGPRLNFRGREVEPASLPYFSDFESGERGTEWDNRSNVTTLDQYSTFTGPLRRAKEVLHVRTEPGQSYILQLDLYLIGFAPGTSNDRSGDFRVEIDGVPMIEQNFGTLREMSLAEGEDEDTNGNIIRQLTVSFTSASGVAEIMIAGDTGPGFGTGSWGFDNVLIDNAPETNLGSFANADFSGDSEIIGDPYIGNVPQGGAVGFTGRTSEFRERTPRRFRDSSNLRAEQTAFLNQQRRDFLDMFPEQPEDPDNEDPDDDDEPETPDEEVPAPGPAALMLLGAGAAGFRRRRES